MGYICQGSIGIGGGLIFVIFGYTAREGECGKRGKIITKNRDRGNRAAFFSQDLFEAILARFSGLKESTCHRRGSVAGQEPYRGLTCDRRK